MAMNKKEKAEMERLGIVAALRWSGECEPDMPVPTEYRHPEPGYMFNVYGCRVTDSCSTANFHSATTNKKTTSQAGIRQYSTRLLALRGLRAAVEKRAAKELYMIDEMIEEENKS